MKFQFLEKQTSLQSMRLLTLVTLFLQLLNSHVSKPNTILTFLASTHEKHICIFSSNMLTGHETKLYLSEKMIQYGFISSLF